MKGKITRLSSRNHQINHELSADGRQAKVSLASPDGSESDFVLYIKDDMASIPAAISHVNQFGEQTVYANILPDIRPPKIKAKYLPNILKIDTSQSALYDPKVEEEEESDDIFAIEPKLYEYVFLIDRSGSMSGTPMKLAVEALILFLHSLPIGSKFNVVSYGSDYVKLFPQS